MIPILLVYGTQVLSEKLRTELRAERMHSLRLELWIAALHDEVRGKSVENCLTFDVVKATTRCSEGVAISYECQLTPILRTDSCSSRTHLPVDREIPRCRKRRV